MFQGRSDRQAGTAVYMKAVAGLTNVAAAILTFFVCPIAHRASAPFVIAFTDQNYAPGLAPLISGLWFVALAALLFFGGRALIGAAITMGGLAIAARFF